MIKKLLIGVVVLLVVAVGGVIFYLDSLVKGGIEVVGSEVLGVEVRVGGVSLSPLSGQGSISGLTIANPEGFDSPYAFELGEVALQLDIGSLRSDVIEITSVAIDTPRITYETDIRTDNIRTLLARVGGEGGEEQTTASGSSAGKDLLIREFRMLDPQLDVITPIASAPVPLPEIVINDIGTGDNGASAQEVLQLILGRINRAVLEGNIPAVQELRNSLQNIESEARDAVDDAVEDLGNRLRSILN